MMDRRTRWGLVACGLGCIAASILLGILSGGEQTLSIEKAKEIQQARREFHSLSHKYAHHSAGDRLAGGEPIPFDKNELQQAEERFNRLHEEVEAIRNQKPWLIGMLRYGGIALCVVAGLTALQKPAQKEQVIDQASASSIAAYESEIQRRG